MAPAARREVSDTARRRTYSTSGSNRDAVGSARPGRRRTSSGWWRRGRRGSRRSASANAPVQNAHDRVPRGRRRGAARRSRHGRRLDRAGGDDDGVGLVDRHEAVRRRRGLHPPWTTSGARRCRQAVVVPRDAESGRAMPKTSQATANSNGFAPGREDGDDAVGHDGSSPCGCWDDGTPACGAGGRNLAVRDRDAPRRRVARWRTLGPEHEGRPGRP